jgi:outer membrane lipoprotein LolB
VYSGRFTVSYDKEGSAQREQGAFEWNIQAKAPITSASAQEAAMQLALLSPVGSTIALITFKPTESVADERASLKTPAQTLTAPDLDTLMDDVLGWRLPLSQILPWLSKDTPQESPADWTITVTSRHDDGMPKLITAENRTLKLSARLVFDEATK